MIIKKKKIELSERLISLLENIEEIISADQTASFMTNEQIAAQLTSLLASHPLEESDWRPYVHFDERKYTRNLIALGRDERFGLMILAWGAGQGSPIHDHSDSHCVMRVLQGNLKESLYEVESAPGKLLRLTKQNHLKEGDVAYIHDRIGWHSVGNCSSSEVAISLHLYAPPIQKCRTVEEASGRIRAKAACPYYSKYGQIIRYNR